MEAEKDLKYSPTEVVDGTPFLRRTVSRVIYGRRVLDKKFSLNRTPFYFSILFLLIGQKTSFLGLDTLIFFSFVLLELKHWILGNT